MDEDIEDLVGDVKYTDSQKSVATSNVYSQDFTDSSSEQHNSSGKETYVIDRDDSDSDVISLHDNQSVINLRDPRYYRLHKEAINKINKSTSSHFHIAQEIFTQTSKTIFELAETEATNKAINSKTLETQTSFISVEDKIVKYKIQVSDARTHFKSNVQHNILEKGNNDFYVSCNQILETSLDDDSSKFPITESENDELNKTKSDNSIGSRYDDVIKIIDDGEEEEFRENLISEPEESQYEDTSTFEKSDTDIDEDSLMCYENNESKNNNADNTSNTSEVPKSVDSDVEDLYKKLSEKINVSVNRPLEPEIPHYIALSPLTEESEKVTVKAESIMDITPGCHNISSDLKDNDKYLVFTNNGGIKVKALPSDHLKLPPITNNHSCPASPRLNFLFSENSQLSNKPYSVGERREWSVRNRWEMDTKDLAAGEGAFISGRSDPAKKTEVLSLPPINVELCKNNVSKNTQRSINGVPNSVQKRKDSINKIHDSISIKDKITELKISGSLKHGSRTKYNVSTIDSKTSRSASPGSISPERSRLEDLAERGCEALCLELLRRLRSASWFEIADTLEEIPKVMDRFWGVISEHRIADLIRQVSCHVESPRTQVARSACLTLSSILKNTNYTKKPDFYEAVTSLLVKTGSYSRPVRRAANVALDGVVSGVELTHAVTALCIHGVGHKSPLVRCAAARLLVVCCALAGGGRGLLRTRPPSAVCARRHALRALAALLEDKSTETRKYAERLYLMLRPLHGFEAYFLTDMEVDVAARQMKRFDRLLLCAPGETR